MITYKEYIQIAKRVLNYYRFSYFQNKGWAIISCANHLRKVCKERPHLSESYLRNHLLVVAKHFYITENNNVYAIHQKRKKA